MTFRRCLACHSRAHTEELIPLHLTEGGSLGVGRAPQGRGGWVHPRCVHAAVGRPSGFHRCFRAKTHGAAELPRRIESWMIVTLRRHLRRALNDGLAVKKSAGPIDNATLTIRSSAHPDAEAMPDKTTIYEASTCVFQLDHALMSQILDQGPCLELKINAGRSTHGLLRSLRAWDRWG